MPKASDVRIIDASCVFEPIVYRLPMMFGGRPVDKVALVNIELVVETRDGKRKARGQGSMPLGNVWAWPSTVLTPEQTETAMKKFAEEIVELASGCPEVEHPVDLIYHLWGECDHLGKKISAKLKYPESMPDLAQAVAASALDAAIHDAYGRVHGVSSYQTLNQKFMHHDLSHYLDKQFAKEYPEKYLQSQPAGKLALYHCTGQLDPLTSQDVQKKIGDSYPESLQDWVATQKITHVKIKLGGQDLSWDLNRIIAVDRVVSDSHPQGATVARGLSLDFNEKCETADYVIELLRKLKEQSPRAFDLIENVEQPLNRDLTKQTGQNLKGINDLKPLMLDESLVDYDALLAGREMGYSAIALKAGKGHTSSLLLACAAQKLGMKIFVQDLTCPGYSFLHSVSLASRIPGVTSVEGNGRQFCPAANKLFVKQFPGVFDIKDGTVSTAGMDGDGLGF